MSHGTGALYSIPLPFDVPFMGNTFDITSTMTTSLAITVLLSVAAIAVNKKLTAGKPGKMQNVAEFIVGGLRNFYASVVGKEMADKLLPLLGTFFLFIIVSNYSGILPGAGMLPGFAAPTSVLSVTAGLAIVVFFATHILGIQSHGIGYFKHFIQPFAFMLPLLIIEEFVRPFSLSLRLYGNIYGEEMAVHQINGLAPIVAAVPIQGMSLLFGFIQALVFTLLTAIYINGAAGEGH